MPQTQQYKVQGPDGAEHVIEGPAGASDDDVIAQAQKLFGASTAPTATDHTPHGATGSWDSSAADLPSYLGKPLDALARFGKGAVDAVTGIPKSIYAAATTPPTTDYEQTLDKAGYGRASIVAKRLLVDPQVDEFNKSHESLNAGNQFSALGHAVAAAVPVAGPMAAGLAEKAVNGDTAGALGNVAGGFVMGKVLGELPDNAIPGLKPSPVESAMSERRVSALASRISSGVKGNTKNAYDTATVALPLVRQAASEMGITDLDKEFPSTRRGEITESGKVAVRTAGDKAVDIFNHAVDISERPFKDALDKVSANTPATRASAIQVRNQVAGQLNRLAAENSDNPALAKSLSDMANKAANASTFAELNDLKQLSNKKAASLFDKSLGGQINADANVSSAWKFLGDTIRGNMYPELTKLTGVDLRAAGAREASMMDARDGLMQEYNQKVLPAHADRTRMTYFENLSRGSLYRHNLMKRALMLDPTPAAAFNADMSRGIGSVPPSPSVVPFYPPPVLPTPGPGGIQGVLQGGRTFGPAPAPGTQAAPVYSHLAPPPAVAATGVESALQGGASTGPAPAPGAQTAPVVSHLSPAPVIPPPPSAVDAALHGSTTTGAAPVATPQHGVPVSHLHPADAVPPAPPEGADAALRGHQTSGPAPKMTPPPKGQPPKLVHIDYDPLTGQAKTFHYLDAAGATFKTTTPIK